MLPKLLRINLGIPYFGREQRNQKKKNGVLGFDRSSDEACADLPPFAKCYGAVANASQARDFCCMAYWVPVNVTLQLKVVRLPVFAAAVNVSVAEIDCPALKT